MSKINQTVFVFPSVLCSHNDKEIIKLKGFECPSCNGNKTFIKEIGQNKNEEYDCERCNGTGTLNAEMVITWFPSIR